MAADVARWFLVIAAVVFALVYALPILVVPLRWARVFRWTLPENTDLCVYFGRCLGSVAVALVVGGAVAASDPVRYQVVLLMVCIAGGLLTLVHVVGALTRSQPWTEHVEIPLYAVLFAASLWLYLAVR